MEVLLFPYLPLRERRTVGSWELIPRESIESGDCISEEMVGHARGVAALYRLPGDGGGYGAFVRRTDLRVGDETTDDLSTLRNAVAVALLDLNPSRAGRGRGAGECCARDVHDRKRAPLRPPVWR